MYLRSVVVFHCRIWLVGLPDAVAKAIAALPPARRMELSFSVCDELPDAAEHKPDCVILSLAPGRAQRARSLGDEDTLLVGWRAAADERDGVSLPFLDDLWDAPTEALLAYRFAWAQDRLWRRRYAWLCYTFWQTTVNMGPNLVWYKSLDGTHLSVNQALADTAGKTVEDCCGQRYGYIWGISPQDGGKDAEASRASDQKVVDSGRPMVGVEQVMGNGELRDLKTFRMPLFDKEGHIIGTAGMAQDVTLLNRYHREILDMAHRDELTGLFNRRFFYEYVAKSRTTQTVCLFSIDLDRFKEVNDRHGHTAGDEALKAVGAILVEAFPTGVVCRFGGDEFLVILLESLSPGAARGMAEAFLTRLRAGLHETEAFRVLTASVGIVLSDDADCPIDELIRRSDEALYEAKSAGRDCVRVARGV